MHFRAHVSEKEDVRKMCCKKFLKYTFIYKSYLKQGNFHHMGFLFCAFVHKMQSMNKDSGAIYGWNAFFLPHSDHCLCNGDWISREDL